MIDLHAHILPGVDDGPADVEATVALGRAAAANGTTRLATTSHVDHGFALDPGGFAGWRQAAQAALDAAGVELELVQGGELELARSRELSGDELRAITLGAGGTVLLEPPFVAAGAALEHAVSELQTRGFSILLAHPGRSPDFQARLDELAVLAERGVRFQITASSLSGAFGRPAQALCEELHRRGMVHVIASDCHGADSRTPDVHRHLDAAAKRFPVLAAEREYFTQLAPAAILAGEDAGPPPAPAAPGRLARLRPRR